MKRIIKKVIKLVMLVAAATLAAALLPYLWHPDVTDSFKAEHAGALPPADAPCADEIALLEDGRTAFLARLEVLRNAETNLDISYYAIEGENDGTSVIFLSEVYKAAERGVKVRLLLDGKAPSIRKCRSLLSLISAHDNITVRLYNPWDLFRPWTWNAFMHDKYIIADEKHLILGGRNISDRFFSAPWFENEYAFDLDAIVKGGGEGSVLPQVNEYFETFWSLDCVKPFSSTQPDSSGIYLDINSMLAAAELLEMQYPQYFAPMEDAAVSYLPTDKITLIHNSILPRPKRPELLYNMLELLGNSSGTVRLQTPYCPVGTDIIDKLADTREGLEAFVLQTNSMASSPNFPAFSGYMTIRGDLLKADITVSEYQGSGSIHSKCAAGDNWAALGSFNLDERSVYTNTENMLVVTGQPFAACMNEYLDTLAQQSRIVGGDGTYLEGDVPLRESPPQKASMLKVLSYFSYVFRFLLSAGCPAAN